MRLEKIGSLPLRRTVKKGLSWNIALAILEFFVHHFSFKYKPGRLGFLHSFNFSLSKRTQQF